MSVLTINGSNSNLEWSKLHNISKKKDSFTLMKSKESSTFVSDFPSPTDELIKKTGSKTESQKSEKRSRPFSHTSENWIG